MIEIARVEDRALVKSLDDKARRSKQLASVFRRLRPHMIEDQKQHAQREEGPDGAWAPRAPATRERKRVFRQTKKKKGAVEATYFTVNGTLGALPELVVARATGFTVFVKSMVRWASVHQEGGTVGRGSVIPARPFLWVSDELAQRAQKMIADFVMDGR